MARLTLILGVLATVMVYELAPRSYEILKVVSKDSTVKVLTVFNHLTKPRD